MNIISVASPSFCADGVSILCLVEFDDGEDAAQFVASPNDCMGYGRDIHARALAGEFGAVAAYVAAPTPVPQSVSALQGLLAIDQQTGLASAYTAWASDSARTFAERAFIDKAQTWKRDDPTLMAAAVAFGLTSTQIDNLFVLAASL